MIFQRWIMAADRLGPLYSGMASYTVNDLSHVLSLCDQTSLAQNLRLQGPRALTSLSLDARDDLASRVEPTMRPSLKSLLLSEAVEMERSVAIDGPCRLVVFGRVSGSESVAHILKAEFPHQRGTAVSLARPTASAIALFDRSRHQLLWPDFSSASSSTPLKNVERVRFPAQEPPPGTLWNLSRLACLNPHGLFYTSYASKPMAAMDPREALRYGALTLLGTVADDLATDRVADVLFTSAARTIPPNIPIAFLAATTDAASNQHSMSGEKARLFLDARENYGRIDFDPLEQTAVVSVLKAKSRAPVAKMKLSLSKDKLVSLRLTKLQPEVAEGLVEAIYADLKGGHRRKRAEKQATEVAALALPMACRYVDWIERHPEAPIFEREGRLRDLEKAMTEDSPPLLRRDFYKAFKHFLTDWGLR